jgi:hypothetical protein
MAEPCMISDSTHPFREMGELLLKIGDAIF